MIKINYTARRQLIAGHSVNDSIILNIKIEDDDDMPKMVGHESLSMGGASVYVHDRNEEFYQALTVSVKDADYLALRECMHSINEGELFLIDRYNDGAYVTAQITKAPARIKVKRRIYKYSFRARILS